MTANGVGPPYAYGQRVYPRTPVTPVADPVQFKLNFHDPMGPFGVAQAILGHAFVNKQRPNSLQEARKLAAEKFTSTNGTDFAKIMAAKSIRPDLVDNHEQRAQYDSWFRGQNIGIVARDSKIENQRINFDALTNPFNAGHGSRGNERQAAKTFDKTIDFSGSHIVDSTISHLRLGTNMRSVPGAKFKNVKFENCVFSTDISRIAKFKDCEFINCTVIDPHGNQLDLPMFNKDAEARIRESFTEWTDGQSDRLANTQNLMHRMTNPLLGEGATKHDFQKLIDAYQPGGAVETLKTYLGLSEEHSGAMSTAALVGMAHALPAAE